MALCSGSKNNEGNLSVNGPNQVFSTGRICFFSFSGATGQSCKAKHRRLQQWQRSRAYGYHSFVGEGVAGAQVVSFKRGQTGADWQESQHGCHRWNYTFYHGSAGLPRDAPTAREGKLSLGSQCRNERGQGGGIPLLLLPLNMLTWGRKMGKEAKSGLLD